MNILIDSPNCNQYLGSNGNIGYGYTIQALIKNRVFLQTNEELYQRQNNAIPVHALKDGKIYCIKPGMFKKWGLNIDHLFQSYFTGRKIIKENKIDLIHTVEPGQIFMPRPLCFLNRPFILGPWLAATHIPAGNFWMI
ncbi:MAG: hypothetical protein ABIA63_04260 [bacterium]